MDMNARGGEEQFRDRGLIKKKQPKQQQQGTHLHETHPFQDKRAISARDGGCLSLHFLKADS